jgi:hypothetical protein
MYSIFSKKVKETGSHSSSLVNCLLVCGGEDACTDSSPISWLNGLRNTIYLKTYFLDLLSAYPVGKPIDIFSNGAHDVIVSQLGQRRAGMNRDKACEKAIFVVTGTMPKDWFLETLYIKG